MNDTPSIARRVVGTIGVNATMLNAGLLLLCAWYIATKQDIPDILLGALIGQAGNTLGSLSSVLNSTRAANAEEVQPVQVLNKGVAEAIPVADT